MQIVAGGNLVERTQTTFVPRLQPSTATQQLARNDQIAHRDGPVHEGARVG
jgi:hypothetical protein